MKKRSITQVAEEIFRREKRPLHYKELTEMIMHEHNLKGRTPHETVRSAIGTDSRFKRVAEGVYALIEWTEYPVARFAKDIAYDVLRSHREPMALTALGEAILEERHFAGGPNQVARNATRTDKRFYYDSENRIVGLVEWGMPSQTASSQN